MVVVEQPRCGIYVAESTIPGAGLGMYAGQSFPRGSVLGSDAAIISVSLDQHASPFDDPALDRRDWYYHWPLVNYDWSLRSIGLDKAGLDDVTATVSGFGGELRFEMRRLALAPGLTRLCCHCLDYQSEPVHQFLISRFARHPVVYEKPCRTAT